MFRLNNVHPNQTQRSQISISCQCSGSFVQTHVHFVHFFSNLETGMKPITLDLPMRNQFHGCMCVHFNCMFGQIDAVHEHLFTHAILTIIVRLRENGQKNM